MSVNTTPIDPSAPSAAAAPAGHPQIAETIREQIGGRAFAQITGAHTFRRVANGYGLSFRLRSNPRRVAAVTIILEPSDTYRVRFERFSPPAGTMTLLSESSGIYAEDLLDLFEMETGLYATLHRRP